MSLGLVRLIAAVVAVVLMTGCGAVREGMRSDEPTAREPTAREISRSRFFIPREPAAHPRLRVSDAELAVIVQELLAEVRIDEVREEWKSIVSDVRFHSLRAERPRHSYRLLLANWSPSESALQDITLGYQQWCSVKDRRSHCIPLPRGQASLGESEVYQVAFDFAMGSTWDGFAKEMKGMVQPATVKLALLMGLVVMMACIALPELTSKIPVAIVTGLLTAYLGAEAVCELVFGWFDMVREVGRATTFEQVQAAGERYGKRIGAETARVLVMVAMTAISQGGVIAKLMRLPQIGAAEAALAADTGVGLESISQVSGAKVIQEGVYITVEGTAQGAVGVAMAGRGNFPSDQTDSATQATAHDGREPGTTTTAGEAGPGEWVADAKESMPENSRSYQSQVTGKPPRSAYKVRGVKLPNGKVTDVKFDGFIPGEEFQECKGPGYADFLDKKRPGRFQWWFEESQKAESGMVTQAKRQLEVAKGRLPVRWYVAEREVADAIRRLLEANNAGEVEVIYRPFLPGKGVK